MEITQTSGILITTEKLSGVDISFVQIYSLPAEYTADSTLITADSTLITADNGVTI